MLELMLNNRRPIYEQLTEGITRLVVSGVLEPGAALPSVRELATELAINPNTVQKAFTELERSGVSYSVNGKGRFVTDDVKALKKKQSDGIFHDIAELLKKLKKYGISEEETVERIKSIYRGEQHD